MPLGPFLPICRSCLLFGLRWVSFFNGLSSSDDFSTIGSLKIQFFYYVDLSDVDGSNSFPKGEQYRHLLPSQLRLQLPIMNGGTSNCYRPYLWPRK